MLDLRKFRILAAILAVFLLVGCGGSVSVSEPMNSTATYGASSDYYDEESAEVNYVDYAKYDAETNSFAGKKLVYSANLALETKDYGEVKKALLDHISKYNAVIDSSTEDDYDDQWWESSNRRYVQGRVYEVNLRVNVENFDAFIKDLSNLENVRIKNQNISSSDKTKQYNDNQLRITELEVQEKRLVELLSEAQNVTEILEIEDRLASVRYELKSLNQANNNIDYDVLWSNVSIRLREVARYSDENYGFGQRVLDTIVESWENFVNFLKSAVLWLIRALPFILLFGLIIFVINFIRVKQGKPKISLKGLMNLKEMSLIKIFILVILIPLIISLIAAIGRWIW